MGVALYPLHCIYTSGSRLLGTSSLREQQYLLWNKLKHGRWTREKRQKRERNKLLYYIYYILHSIVESKQIQAKNIENCEVVTVVVDIEYLCDFRGPAIRDARIPFYYSSSA